MKLRPPEYGKADRRDGDREGHDGIAGHQNDPAEVAGGLQPRFQDRPVHHALLARHPDLQTRLLAVVLRAYCAPDDSISPLEGGIRSDNAFARFEDEFRYDSGCDLRGGDSPCEAGLLHSSFWPA